MAEPTARCSFEDLIQSSLFTFHIGKDKQPFVVHSKAIAATSQQLNALINNDMAESQTASASMEEVEPDDFTRFVEYAYRCDYTVPSWVQDDNALESAAIMKAPDDEQLPPSHPDQEAPPVEEWATLDEVPAEEWPEPVPEMPTPLPVQAEDFDFEGLSKAQRKKLERRRAAAAAAVALSLRSTFEARSYLQPNEPKSSMLDAFKPHSNSAPEQNFTPVFLAHAWLYTFADMRLIDPLKRLALDKLHTTLLRFQLYDRRVGDVIELARYAYDHGENRKEDGTIEDLRRLVVEYIACEVSTFGKHPAFVSFLEEGGEFVGDFWRLVHKEWDL